MEEILHEIFRVLDIIELTAASVAIFTICKFMPGEEANENEGYRHKRNKIEMIFLIMSIHCCYMAISKYLG